LSQATTGPSGPAQTININITGGVGNQINLPISSPGSALTAPLPPTRPQGPSRSRWRTIGTFIAGAAGVGSFIVALIILL
jgi:hypothetical protein